LHLLALPCPASPHLPDHNGNVLTRTSDQRDSVLSYTNAQSEQIGYRYDASGNLVQLIYPGGKTVTYAYDNRERLSTITDWSARVTTLTWDAAGRLLKVARPNGTYRDYQYDAAGRMIQVAERKANKRGLCVVRFELDAAGRPLKKLTLPQAVSGIPAVTATFDADNRMATLLDYGIPHDADGNMQAIFLPLGAYPVGELYWDTRNRLTDVWEQVWAGNVFLGYNQTQFAYDAEGHRTHKTFNGATTRYTVNPHGLSGMSEVLIEHKPNNIKRWYVWGGPAGLLYESQTNSSGTETAVRYYHSDQVGSTLALTDASANVTGRVEYSPYGLITHVAGVIDTPYLFNGAFGVQTDAETGLHHMRARYYHPWLGRFISEDPIQFSGGNNWYAFTSGDPLMSLDPSGLRESSRGASNDWGQFSSWNTSSGVADTNLSSMEFLNSYNAAVNAEHWKYDGMALEAIGWGVAVIEPGYVGEAAMLGRAGTAAKTGGTVWDSVKATQPLYEGTAIPRSFELATGNGKVWVHGNATEHMAEYATSMLNRGVSPSLVNMGTQAQMTTLQSAVNAATANGVQYGKLLNVGGWELKFGAPQQAGQLPALIHALPR
jgi:RHS repeat-associated protein